MISCGRKSDEKCYVLICRRTRKICPCDKGVLHSGTEYNLLLVDVFTVYTQSQLVNVLLSSATALTNTGFCHWQFIILSHILFRVKVHLLRKIVI